MTDLIFILLIENLSSNNKDLPRNSSAGLSIYSEKIKTEILLMYGVYQVEAEGINLFEDIKGDKDSIMGLPIKQIMNYINQYKK